MPPIRPRERDAVLQSLHAGVVPRTGQHLIQVGRVHELKALIEDIDRVADGGVDFSGPVIRLAALTPEDFYVLLEKLRFVFAYGDPQKFRLPDDALPAFMQHCSQRLGDQFFRTPRTTITSFIDLLSILDSDPETNWNSFIAEMAVKPDLGGEQEKALDAGDELVSFKL